MNYAQSIRAPKQKATLSASRAKRTRGMHKTASHKAHAVDRLGKAAERRALADRSMNMREFIAHWEAGQKAARSLGETPARDIVAIQWDGADESVSLDSGDMINGLDWKHETFQLIFAS